MSNSPTFVAVFADGVETRMTTFSSLVHLDVARGIRLAHDAYRSRMKREPPPIIEARFVHPATGATLATYTTDKLREVQ